MGLILNGRSANVCTVEALVCLADENRDMCGPWHIEQDMISNNRVHIMTFTITKIVMHYLAKHVQDSNGPVHMWNDIQQCSEILAMKLKVLDGNNGYHVSFITDRSKPLCEQWFHKIVKVVIPLEEICRFEPHESVLMQVDNIINTVDVNVMDEEDDSDEDADDSEPSMDIISNQNLDCSVDSTSG